MIIRNTKKEYLDEALEIINREKYEGNIVYKNIEYISKSRGYGDTYRLTLKPVNSRGHGGRISAHSIIDDADKPRHISAVRWHGHGDFFDALLSINPEAIITVTGNTKIFVHTFRCTGRPTENCKDVVNNWDDRNIGSFMYPVYFSEACHCGEFWIP